MPGPSIRKVLIRKIPRRLERIQERHFGRYVRAEMAKEGGGFKSFKVIQRLFKESNRLHENEKLTREDKNRLARRLIEQASFMANHYYAAELLVKGKGNWEMHFADWLKFIEKKVPEKLGSEIRRRTIPKIKKRK